MSKYALTPDLGRFGDKMYACDPMGLFDTVEEAAIANKSLHSSFGYLIYPVVEKVTKNVVRMFGMSVGSGTSGYLITGVPIYSFNVELG